MNFLTSRYTNAGEGPCQQLFAFAQQPSVPYLPKSLSRSYRSKLLASNQTLYPQIGSSFANIRIGRSPDNRQPIQSALCDSTRSCHGSIRRI